MSYNETMYRAAIYENAPPDGTAEREMYEELREGYGRLSKAAADGVMPDGLTLPERACWYRLRDIYCEYRDGASTIEQCTEEKRKALLQMEKDSEAWIEARGVHAHWAGFWQSIETAGREYAKAPSVETADRFYEAVYHVPRREQTLER